MKNKNLQDFFSLKKPRPVQEKALEFIFDAFNRGVKYVIIEAGTGVGKCLGENTEIEIETDNQELIEKINNLNKTG